METMSLPCRPLEDRGAGEWPRVSESHYLIYGMEWTEKGGFALYTAVLRNFILI